MSDAPNHMTPANARGLSSGMRMLLVLTIALLPLGIAALIVSIQSAHSKKVQHQDDARLIATADARQIDLLVIRGGDIVRLAAGTVGDSEARCRRIVDQTTRLLRFDVKIALFAPNGTLRCASADFGDSARPPARSQIGIDVRLEPEDGVAFTVNALDGSYGVGRIPTALLRTVAGAGERGQGVALRQKGLQVVLAMPRPGRGFDQEIAATVPVASGQLSLTATTTINFVTSFEVILVILPVLMWAAAAFIGWIVVNQLLLRPLRDLGGAVAQFGAGGPAAFADLKLSSPAREIEALGQAFAASAERIAMREVSLEEALNHQVRLTREVHHRVKNNLQVVASLINLHARGAEGAVADAYASIQRRVDALAVVHRNHYAELEENRGVALRALLAELTANLRATAPPQANGMTITLDMPAAHISQDTAVPIAFLVTEIVELLIIGAPATAIAIGMAAEAGAGRGLLTIRSAALRGNGCRDTPAFPRFERIATGLSRQLRSALDFDAETGTYAIGIPLVG